METIEKTALVTGAKERLGKAMAMALAAKGWRVFAHVHRDDDPVPDGTTRIAADLSRADAADRIFAAIDGPLGLLVNNAALFREDRFGTMDGDMFIEQMQVNVRAPAMLTERFAQRHRKTRPAGADALVVNMLDNRLAAQNPDFFSYGLTKEALAGMQNIAARALAADGIRVNGIAPSIVLPSGDQDEEEFARVHEFTALGRGVDPEDIVRAIFALVDAPMLTGQTLWLDAGQRFFALPRDVQFLEDE